MSNAHDLTEADDLELDVATAYAEGAADERNRLREIDEFAALVGPDFAAEVQRARFEEPISVGELAIEIVKSPKYQPVDELAERRRLNKG